jgi:hypothetical protein
MKMMLCIYICILNDLNKRFKVAFLLLPDYYINIAISQQTIKRQMPLISCQVQVDIHAST